MPKQVATSEMKLEACNKLELRFKQFGLTVTDITILRVGSGSRPHVARVNVDGQYGVVKDHSGCDPLFSRLLGKLLTRREIRALYQLDDVEGVPKVIRVFDARSFLMTDLDAVPFRGSVMEKDQWSVFFPKLETLIHRIHAEGVAHCDLRSLDNTLVTAKGNPAIVDFVGCFRRGKNWNILTCWMFRRLCAVDYSAIGKQKKAIAPWLLSSNEFIERRQESVFSRLARNTGVIIRKLARSMFTR